MSGMPGAWGTFECLGSPAEPAGDIAIPAGLTGPPAVCRTGSGAVHVFAPGQEGALLHTVNAGGEWDGFESLGSPTIRSDGADHSMPLIEPVAACGCGSAGIAVLLRGPQGDLLLKWWDGAGWSDYASLGWPEAPDPGYPAVRVPAPLTGVPAACSWGPNRMDVFARGGGGDLVHTCWDGEAWSGFESLGLPVSSGMVVPFVGTPTACSTGSGAIDVVARAIDGRLYHASWEGARDGEEVPAGGHGRTEAGPEK